MIAAMLVAAVALVGAVGGRGTVPGIRGPERSVPSSIEPDTSTVRDFEGNTYRTSKIGEQWWMAENLRSTRDSHGQAIRRHAYRNDEGRVPTYGYLYTWDAAMAGSSDVAAGGICPSGWHVPSEEDWNTLFAFAGGDSVAGGALKEVGTSHWDAPNSGATDRLGFHGLPGGGLNDGQFDGLGAGGHYWSSTSVGGQARAPTLHRDTPEIVRLTLPKSFSLSVRCVKT